MSPSQSSTASSAPGLAAAIAAALVAALGVAAFVLLDYGFQQPAHRLVKLLLGGSLIVGIGLWPRFGLLLLPILTPFLGWLPILPVPGLNTLNILVGTVFAGWALGQVLRGGSPFRRGRLSWPLAAILILAALSIVKGAAFPTGFEFNFAGSALELFRTGVTFAIYYVALCMVRGPEDRRRLAAAIAIGLLAEAIATIALGRNGRGGRAVGSIGQANELGAYLSLGVTFVAALLFGVRTMWARVGLSLAVIAGVIATMLSLSRASLVALAVGVGWVVVRSSRMMTFVFLAVLITSPWWTPEYVRERILGTQVEVEGADDMELEHSAQLRVDTWRALADIVSARVLDGVGFGGLDEVLPETGEALGLEVKDSAHNTFLRYLAEMGLLGLGAFLFFLVACFRLARDAARRATNPFDRQMAVGVTAMTLVLAINCAFGDRFSNVMIIGNFFIACALLDDLLTEPRTAREV